MFGRPPNLFILYNLIKNGSDFIHKRANWKMYVFEKKTGFGCSHVFPNGDTRRCRVPSAALSDNLVPLLVTHTHWQRGVSTPSHHHRHHRQPPPVPSVFQFPVNRTMSTGSFSSAAEGSLSVAGGVRVCSYSRLAVMSWFLWNSRFLVCFCEVQVFYYGIVVGTGKCSLCDCSKFLDVIYE